MTWSPKAVRRMHLLELAVCGSVLGGIAIPNRAGSESKADVSQAREIDASTLAELQDRAELLYETLHMTLQVVHHQYYREDEGLTIPAAAMKQVFAEIETRRRIKLRWLAVDAQAMNLDHVARDDFEKQAVLNLVAGKKHYEDVAAVTYRRAAPIRLGSECLKCHLPNRKSTANRMAALIIEIPLTKE